MKDHSLQSLFSNRKVFRLAFGDHSDVMWAWPPHAWDIVFEYFTHQ